MSAPEAELGFALRQLRRALVAALAAGHQPSGLWSLIIGTVRWAHPSLADAGPFKHSDV